MPAIRSFLLLSHTKVGRREVSSRVRALGSIALKLCASVHADTNACGHLYCVAACVICF